MEALGIIFGLAFFVYFPIVGISSLLLARRIKYYGHQGVNPLAKSYWMFFTSFLMTFSVILLVSCLLIVLNHQHSVFELLLLILPFIIFCSASILLEILCYKTASALNKGDQYELPEPLQNRIPKIQVLGLILLGLPLTVLLFCLPLLLIFMVLGPFINILSINKRANESELLWLLAVCVEKNIPIATELDSYSSTLSRNHQKKIQALSNLLHSGEPLSSALSSTSGLLPQSAIIAVRIGEKSNHLGIALRDAAIQSTKNLNHATDKSSIPNLLFYLTLVISIQFFILSFIMYYIIPKFKKIFLDFGAELSPMTLKIMDVSDFIVSYFYLFLPFFTFPLIVLFLIHAGNYFGWNNLRIPFITGWFPRLNTPLCLRQIAHSIAIQQSPLIVLEAVSVLHRWPDVRSRIQSVNHRITQGENIWLSLQKDKVITKSEAALCSAAERMGNLPHVLSTLADTIEKRRARKIRYLSEILKPVLICLLCILVGVIAYALFDSLVSLMNDFDRIDENIT